jgi:predicted AlkP superfamily pyrophosphatase or phosphodiesterase
MLRFLRWFAALLLALASSAPAREPPHPKLIVTLVVDQFAAELFDRYRAGSTGGLKRLSDGIAFVHGYQSHAATETCPGHSTILTGRHPSATGIVANNWYDREAGKSVYCVAVPGADSEARGPQNLRVDTLGTWLKAAEPGAQVVTVSGKDRAAIMLAGHHADAVYWWQDGEGFGTSGPAGPADAPVTDLAERFDEPLLASWRSAPPKLWPAEISPRCRKLERPERFGQVDLAGRIPPEDQTSAPADPGFAASLRASPLFDRVTLDFALQVLQARRLGRGPATDLLAVSLSATDYVGHRYGNGGPEMCVQMAELDRSLGAFFQQLDRLGIPYVVALTADHGASDAAERAARNGAPARRIDGRATIRALNAELRKTFSLTSDPIHGDDLQELTVDGHLDAATSARVRAEAVRWLETQPDIAQVLTREQVMVAAPAEGTPVDKLTMAERFHESFDATRSGDIFVVLPEHVSSSVPVKAGAAVAGHGSPWDYDRLVPILFWWPGVAAQTVMRPIETVDIAPTLAAIAGVRTPQLDGHCLSEVVTCP